MLSVASLLQCEEMLGSDENAEAMRRGFRLAVNVARFDYVVLEQAHRRTLQKAATESPKRNNDARNRQIVLDYLRLRDVKEVEKHKIVTVHPANFSPLQN